MEESKEKNKKVIKISLKNFILFILVLIIIILTIGVIIKISKDKKKSETESIYYKINYILYGGYERTLLDSEDEYNIINSYDEYIKYYNEIKNYEFYYNSNLTTINELEKINSKFSQDFFKDKNLLIFKVGKKNISSIDVNIDNIYIQENQIKIEVCANYRAAVLYNEIGNLILIPINKDIVGINIEKNISLKEENVNVSLQSTDKPVIYLYPEETTKVSVKLGLTEKITCSYPKYEEKGWNVIAEPSGKLTDLDTGRELYCLYWEGLNTNETNMVEGFVVKGEDTIRFLEEKLEILGLNEKEAQEFIIYWLPQMEDNKYNYIRFETIEEINSNMPLEITPKPDNIIRINMEWKELDKAIEVKEQVLEQAPERTGFTVVEWGGTKLN